jgi:hypothetical protein
MRAKAQIPRGPHLKAEDPETHTSPKHTPTQVKILSYCRRKAHKGERVAHHLGLSYDHVRRVLAGLVKRGELRLTPNGYRTVQRAT